MWTICVYAYMRFCVCVTGSLSSEDFDEFGLDDMVEWLFQPKDKGQGHKV